MTASVNRRTFVLGLLCAGAGSRFAYAQAGDPVAITAQIFNDYQRDKVPSVPYTPAIRARMRTSDVGREADIILQAQDTEVKNYTVQPVSLGPDKAVVDARFLSFDRRMHVRFDFRMVDGKWMIANFRHIAGVEHKTDLRRELKMPPLN